LFVCLSPKYKTRNQYASPPRGNAKSQKFGIFGKIFNPKGRIPLGYFFTKLGVGRGSQILLITPKLPIVALETWAEVRESRQNVKFCGKNMPLGSQSLTEINAAAAWERESKFPTLTQNFIIVALKM